MLGSNMLVHNTRYKWEVSMSPLPHMKDINILGADFFSQYRVYAGYNYKTGTLKIHFNGGPEFQGNSG